MFLSQLNNEQKGLFLQLCSYAANSNGIFAEEEKMLMKEYCKEMEIDEPENFEVIDDLEVVINKICDSATLRTKKLILIEIVALILSDKKYDELEQQFVNKIAKDFNVSTDEVEKIVQLLDIHQKACNEIVNFVG